MHNSVKRVLSVIIAAVMLVGMNLGGNALAGDAEDIDISVSQDDLLDVVLTLGQTDTDVSNVQADLTSALTAKGVPADKIKITAVEANEVSAGNTSEGWETYDHVTTGWNFTDPATEAPVAAPVGNTGSPYRHIWVYNGGQKIMFYGYDSPEYKDFMYMPNTSPTKKTFSFTMNDAKINNHSMLGGGFIFNANITGAAYQQVANISSLGEEQSIVSASCLSSQNISGYMLLLIKTSSGSYPALYRFENVNMNTFHSSNALTLVKAETSKVLSGVHDITIEVSGSSFKMTDTVGSTTNTMEYTGLVDTGSYGFGPVAQYAGHGCQWLSWFNFENLQMTTTSVKRFSEVIRQPEWRSESKRFIINAEDGAVADFSDAQALGEILARLGNENIHYLGWGRNAADGNAFIAKNDGKGTFVDKDNTTAYSAQISALADYIYEQYHEDVQNDTEYLIYGKPSALSITPESEQTNTADAEWPNGKWRIDQDEDYYDNSTGVVPYDGIYLNNLDISFTETGKYDIYYQDTIVKTVYVHRKPVASFNLSVDGSYNVSITDNAYDPDFEADPDRGTASETWKYRETTSSVWTDGQPSSFEAGKNYVVKQVVTDEYGVESDPYIRYVSTEASASSVPVAEFKVTPGRLLTHITEAVAYDDTSYDPTGLAITSRAWTVSKDGAQVYPASGTAATPKTDFTGGESGTYKITLKVKNSNNAWSEEVARYLTVVRDTTDPTAVSNTPSGTYNEPKTVQLTFNEEAGGSGFSHRYAVVKNSATSPSADAEWGSMGTNDVYSVTLRNLGANYLHYKAYDYAGNVATGVFGPFTLADTSAPSAPAIEITPAYTDGTWVKGDLSLTASGSTDDFTPGASLVYAFSDDGSAYSAGSTRTFTGATGTFTVYFRVTDASNNSMVVTKTVKIDNTAPSVPDISMLSGGEDYTADTWATQNVSITLSGAADAHSGLGGYQYKIDDGSWQDGSAYTFNVSGVHTFYYRSVDSVGNTSDESSRSVKVDLEAPGEPTIEISPSYTTDWTKETITLTANMSSDDMTPDENLVYEVSEDGTAFTAGNSLVFSNEGTHTGWFRVTDEGGNTVTVSRIIKIDKTAPTKPDITMTSGGSAYTEGSWATADVDIALSGSADTASGVEGYHYKIGNGEWQNGSAYTFDASGEYTVYYRSADGAGNISETGSKDIMVDVDAPEPFSITASATAIDSIDISASTTDVHSGMADYRVFNGTSWSEWKESIDETLTGYSRGQEVTIKVEAKDNAGNIRLAEVTISTLANTAPICADDTYTMKEDASRTTLSVLANDADTDIGRADSDIIKVTAISALSKQAAGKLTLDSGIIKFTPDDDYNGTVSFTYTAADSKGATDTGLVTLTVTAVNDAPVAYGDSIITSEDTDKTVSVLDNDEDVDSTLSIKAVGNPSHGVAAKSGSGIKYTPAKDFNGSDSFTYTITDGRYDSTATVRVTVSRVNDAPKAANDKASTYYMQSVSIEVLSNDTDIDGDELKVSSVSAPKHGSAVISGSKLVYVPAEHFTGDDTFSYTMTDGTEKVTGNVTVTVSYPEGYGDDTAIFSPTAGGTGGGNNSGTNNGGNNGGSGSSGGSGNMTVVSQPTGGTVSTVGGSAYYTPDEGTSGIDTYNVVVDTGNGDVEYQVITDTDEETGETTTLGYGLPVSDESFGTDGGEVRIPLSEYLGDNYDENADITINGQPLNGNVRIEDGYLVYTPSAGFSGLDAVVFTINSGDEQIPYAAMFNVKYSQPLFSPWCILGWVIAALLLTLNYIRHRDYFSGSKARIILYITVSAALCLLLCWLRIYVGFIVTAAILAGYIAGAWLYTWWMQKRGNKREIVL